jgi:hypothetical protein
LHADQTSVNANHELQLLKQGFYGIQDIDEQWFRAYKIAAHTKHVPLYMNSQRQ